MVKVGELSKNQIKAFDHLLEITTANLRWEKLTPEQQQGFIDSVSDIIHTMDQVDKKEG